MFPLLPFLHSFFVLYSLFVVVFFEVLLLNAPNKLTPISTSRAGTYEHDVERNRKVGYHGTFGGPQHLKIQPDESVLLPEDCKGTTEKSRMMTYKEKRKFAIREAYLSLYY